MPNTKPTPKSTTTTPPLSTRSRLASLPEGLQSLHSDMTDFNIEAFTRLPPEVSGILKTVLQQQVDNVKLATKLRNALRAADPAGQTQAVADAERLCVLLEEGREDVGMFILHFACQMLYCEKRHYSDDEEGS